jgi:hypothetical protein
MSRRSRIFLMSILAVVLLSQLVIEPGTAQTNPPDTPSAAVAQAVITGSKRNQLESVLGREVRTAVEEDGGRIIDLLVDRQGQVSAAVIEFGGFLGIGTRKIAVEWSALRFEGTGKQSVILVDVTRDQLRRAPDYKPGETAVVRRAAD